MVGLLATAERLKTIRETTRTKNRFVWFCVISWIVLIRYEDCARHFYWLRASRGPGSGPEQRSQLAGACGLQETHHAHVAKAKKEERQERDRAPHLQTSGVEDCQKEVDRKAQLE